MRTAGAVVALAVALSFGPQTNETGTQETTYAGVARGTDYASAYADCAAHEWPEAIVTKCRWSAAVYFGGQHDIAYYRTHTTEES